MKSPFSFAHMSIEKARVLRTYLYVAEKDQFYDLKADLFLRRQSVDGLYAHAFDKTPSTQLLRSNHLRKVRRTAYLPGTTARFTDDVVNTWIRGPLHASPGPFPNIHALLEHLLPVADERRHALSYLAFIVQNPGAKISHALVIRGIQGCGKSTLLTIVRGLVGDTNHKDAEGAQLLSRFRLDLTNIQVLAVEEVAYGDRRDVAETMKTMLTQRFIRVEEKFQPVSSARTPDAVLLVSNHHTPIPLTGDDRRYWVPQYIGTKPESDLFSRLYSSMEEELPAFLHHLQTLDLTAFDPDRPPPISEAKLEMIADSKPGAEAEIVEWIERREGCMARDIVIPEHLVSQLRAAGYPNLTAAYARRVLRNIGAQPCLNPLPRPRPGQEAWQKEVRVWAVRNHEHWRSASKAELSVHMRGQDGQFARPLTISTAVATEGDGSQ